MSAHPISVLFLNYEYPPLGGGAANATAYLLREFTKRGDISVDLVTSSTDTFAVDTLSDAIRIHRLDIGKGGNPHYQTNGELLRYARRAKTYARRLMRERCYDLCHAFFGIPCGYIARGLGLPYIVSLRGSDVPFYNPRFRVLDRIIFQRMSRKIWRDAARVVANSEGLRQLALKTAPEQAIAVIPNGVDTTAFTPSVRIRSGLRVLCVSRLIARKGIDVLLEALARIDDPMVTLRLVGRGDQEEDLKTHAATLGITDRVEFAGYVPHEELPRLYQEADAFALPSKNEGMSNTVLEAMACGLPLLLTDTGGTSELLRDGENGFIIKDNSPADIAEKLRNYAAHPEWLNTQGAASRGRAEKMSWRAVADAYAALYEQLARSDAS
jgi:L-malate glycosyltransferase